MGLKSKPGIMAGSARKSMQQEILKGIEAEGLAVGKRLLGTWHSAKRQQSAPSQFNRCREALV